MNRKSIFIIVLITSSALVLYFVTGSKAASKNASYYSGNAPWDGEVPTIAIKGKNKVYSFYLTKEFTLQEGQTVSVETIPLFSICNHSGDPNCLLERPSGNLKILKFKDNQYISGQLQIEHSEGAEEIEFSATYTD